MHFSKETIRKAISQLSFIPSRQLKNNYKNNSFLAAYIIGKTNNKKYYKKNFIIDETDVEVIY